MSSSVINSDTNKSKTEKSGLLGMDVITMDNVLSFGFDVAIHRYITPMLLGSQISLKNAVIIAGVSTAADMFAKDAVLKLVTPVADEKKVVM